MQLESFSMCMSYGFNQLWTGQKDGTLHVLDAAHGMFDIVEVSMPRNFKRGIGSLFYPCVFMGLMLWRRDHIDRHVWR